jgi:hypothetical protein
MAKDSKSKGKTSSSGSKSGPAVVDETELETLREELKVIQSKNRELEIQILQNEARAIEKKQLKKQITEEKQKYDQNIKKLKTLKTQ